MLEVEAFDMLQGNNGSPKRSLTSVLDEMGFSRDSYMVINRQQGLPIGDMFGQENGFYIRNEYTSVTSKDFETTNQQMRDISSKTNGGTLIPGIVGSNNGVHSAMAYGGDEMIITTDREIINQLQDQLCFRDGMGVPLSNGGKILNNSCSARNGDKEIRHNGQPEHPVDYKKQQEWEHVQHYGKQKQIERCSGRTPAPKTIKSPFRDDNGKVNESYAKFRSDKLVR